MSIDLKRVFNLDRNVFIEACAGAGKTWLLSKRYAVIIDDFARQHTTVPDASLNDASRILVITFTKKAQSEMAGRIYSDLNKLLNDESLDHVAQDFGLALRKSSEKFKTHIRSTFSKHAISTIDSFCTQILREYADKLDLDPEFRIQDEADVIKMEMETWESFLRDQSNRQNENLVVLLQHLSVFHLEEYMKKLKTNAHLIKDWQQYFSSHTPEELEAEYRSTHPIEQRIYDSVALFQDLVSILPDESEVLNKQDSVYQQLESLRKYLESPHSDAYQHGLNLLEYLGVFALTQASTIRKSPYTKNGVWSDENKTIIRSKLKTIIDYVATHLTADQISNMPNRWDLEALTVQHHLSLFFSSYWNELTKRYMSENVLSFNDIIVKAHDLLRNNPIIAERYGQKFSHILFDEFQDTNDLRWEIIRMIASYGTDDFRDRGLFIVGDTKQSIYRFNQADVQVMNKVRKMLESSNGIVETADITYRSSRCFVDSVVNPIVGKVFQPEESKNQLPLYDTYFKPTVVTNASPLSQEEQTLVRSKVSVVLDEGTRDSHFADIHKTADSVSEWLTWIDSNKIKTKDGPAIGILLRSTTRILDYIREFTARGLDFEVVASKGLFEQQETYDIYHLLSVLVNPYDDIALVGVLRSPFFILKDSHIQDLRDAVDNRYESGWVWKSLQENQPKIYSAIKSWRSRSAREPVDRIMTDIIAEGERQMGWISETSGDLRIANIHRLIELIHSLSLDGLSLREIQEYFRFQIQHGDSGQAELPGSKPVQIMTIHKAKGLEFPVVILPECQRTDPVERSGMFIGKLDEEMTVGIQTDTLQGSNETSTFRQLKEIDKLENEAEDRRLFYVALTRAKFGVEFISRLKPEGRRLTSSWWERYIIPGFEIDWDKQRIMDEPLSVRDEWLEASTEKRQYDLTISSDNLGETRGDHDAVAAPGTEIIQMVGGHQYEDISPHTIMNWMVPGLDGDSDAQPVGGDYGDIETPRKFGTLLHRVLEMGWLDVQKHASSIQQYLNELEIFKNDRALVMDDLSACVTIFSGSELYRELSQIPASDKYAEMPVFGYLQSKNKTFKVSGIIDLLYHDGSSWVVLDYKSDRELPDDIEAKEYAYWFQIQTYLWILKLMYGVVAKGVLYFNRLDETIEIEAEEARYFDKLTTIEKDLSPVIINRTECEDELKLLFTDLHQGRSAVLLEPTKTSAEYLTQYLAKEKLLTPRIQVTTLSELRKQYERSGRRLTTHVARLGVANIVPRDTKWGTINRMAEACYRACREETIESSQKKLFERFLSWCEVNDIIMPSNDAQLVEPKAGTEFIVHSIHSTSPGDYEFLQDLSQNHPMHFMDPLQDGSMGQGFGMKIENWNLIQLNPVQPPEHSYSSFFSINEEVRSHAQYIKYLESKGTTTSDIVIAVSSMERYIPVIKRVFQDHGISIRLNKREPILERPIVQLALTLLKGRLTQQLSWDMLMSVWLHPLVLPSGRRGDDRLKLDVEVRRTGLYYYDSQYLDSIKLPHLERTIQDLKQFVAAKWMDKSKRGLSDLVTWLGGMLHDHVISDRMEPGSVALKSYNSLKRALDSIAQDWSQFMKRIGGTADLYREVKERLRGVEVASRSQGFGVDVISYLDSLNLMNEHLLVMGMNEGQFPLTVDKHPYLKTSDFNPWFMNAFLFSRWLKRDPEELFITAPLRDMEGNSLQVSSFCQYLKEVEPAPSKADTPYERIQSMVGKLITDPASGYELRHNALQRSGDGGAWSGQLTQKEEKSDISISSSAMDDLLKCPQRFWYKRQLSLEVLETDLTRRDETWVGNLVHEVLEAFGHENGFELAVKNLDEALNILKKTAEKVLKEKVGKTREGAMDIKWMELYFQNYKDPNRNLIAAMLKQESDILSTMKEGNYEQKFGYHNSDNSWPEVLIENDKIKLKVRGKIDRVMVADDYVWGTDYKTGEIEVGDTREFWTSQMLYYYLALKMRYPEKNTVITYEQLKSYKGNKFGIKGFIGEVGSDHPVMKYSTGKDQIPIGETFDWSIDRIRKETLAYAQYIADNNYPLTARDEDKACKYCDFVRICRKTSLPN